MGKKKYDRLQDLPISTDFKSSAPDGFEGAWKAARENAAKPFGRFNTAALLRIKEAKLTEKNLQRLVRGDLVAPEMVAHIRALPIKNVFAVNQMLCFALSEHIEGKGKNAFLPVAGLNKALEEYKLPPMNEPVSE